MNKHTATPPMMELPLESSESNTETHYLIYDRRGRELARQLSKRDAAYIVKAVNAYESDQKKIGALTEALKLVKCCIVCNDDFSISYAIDKNTNNRINAALKLAGEE